MKKNENILAYAEKYKKKYDIKIINEKSKLYKGFKIAGLIVWIYSIFWLAITVLSYSLNFAIGKLAFSEYKKLFLTTAICMALMIVAVFVYKYWQKIVALALAVVVQPIIVFTYKPVSVYGMGYKPKFYYAYSIPAVLIVLIAAVMLFILISAIIKENRLYNQIIYDLYKQHGTRDGEKLDEQEWQEFLDTFDPTKANDLNKQDE